MIRETVYMPDLATYLKLERRLFAHKRTGDKPEKVQPPPIVEYAQLSDGYVVVRVRPALRERQVFDKILATVQPGGEVFAAAISAQAGIPLGTVHHCLRQLGRDDVVKQVRTAKGAFRTFRKAQDAPGSIPGTEAD